MGASVQVPGFLGGASGFNCLNEHLDKLVRRSDKFEVIEIYSSPLNPLYNHHRICLTHRSQMFGVCCCSQVFTLKVDFGQAGLQYEDVLLASDSSRGWTRLESKLCNPDPRAVKLALQEVQDSQYDLLIWNCQNFCRYLMKRLSIGDLSDLFSYENRPLEIIARR